MFSPRARGSGPCFLKTTHYETTVLECHGALQSPIVFSVEMDFIVLAFGNE